MLYARSRDFLAVSQNALTLGDKARFMFTSEMTNCRFSVLTGDMAKPMVSRVGGHRQL